MKNFILYLWSLSFMTAASAQTCHIIQAKNAKKFIGKEVIVTGKLCSYGNSSYLQSAWFYLGADTSNKQLKVIVEGKAYGRSKTWVGAYVGRQVWIKGIVKKNQGIYLDATDTLKFKD